MNRERLTRSALVRDGLTLAVHDSGGDGVPVIFQHGLCGDVGQTAEAFPDDPRFRMVTLECRGHGTSDAGPDFSIATFADDLAALIERLGLAPVIVGGISMGAAIASRLAVRRPDLVRALVLARPAWVAEAAPANMGPNAEVGRLLSTQPANVARQAFVAGDTHARLAAEAPDNLKSLLGFFDRQPVAVTGRLLAAISADGPGISETDLGRLGVPTLVMATGHDVIHPLAHAAHLDRLIPNATLVELTPKGVDRPAHVAEFHAALSGFLKDL